MDEPELHLHPSWQVKLLSLLEKLATETNNQFLLATHSPAFVSPISIQYVSRVSSDQQRSRIHRLDATGLPQAKHLFTLVNSQNNEKVFFADAVVLVEGISDRLFLEAVLKRFQSDKITARTIEIVDVGGKGAFRSYGDLLKACGVPYSIVADLDYIRDVGTEQIKSLFTTSRKRIIKNVIKKQSSKDLPQLIEGLDLAIKTNDTNYLQSVWDYIKARQASLRDNLTPTEGALIDEFIASMYQHGTYILRKGDLEAYLPPDHTAKDIDKLIKLLNDDKEDFWSKLQPVAQSEIQKIIEALIKPISNGTPTPGP